MPRTVMLDILSLTVGERARVTASDPITTPGTENWRWATRFCRDDLRLRERGWVSCRHDQIDGIRNDILGIKLVAINTDARTGVPSKIPSNVEDNGPAAARLVERNLGQATFSFIRNELPSPLACYGIWYFCLHDRKSTRLNSSH